MKDCIKSLALWILIPLWIFVAIAADCRDLQQKLIKAPEYNSDDNLTQDTLAQETRRMDLDNKPSAVLQAGIFEDLQRKIDEDSAIKDVGVQVPYAWTRRLIVIRLSAI